MKKLLGLFKKTGKQKNGQQCQVIPRDQHCISRKNVSENAIKVLYRLKKNGYQAYLVGGCVRDLLLGREPKDFDIATNALPHEIKQCFRNGRLIGRRFRLVHILFRNEIIEVSTFRGEHEAKDQKTTHTDEGLIVRDNIYGNLEQDVNRRDFTVNALYYNIADFSVLDSHQGLEDLKQGILRSIGDPVTRYKEDPVRMLRAIRFASKLGFRIEHESEAPIFKYGNLLSAVSPHRLFNEILKLFLGQTAQQSFHLLRHYELLKYLFPETEKCLQDADFAHSHDFLDKAIKETDHRLSTGKTVSPGYLIAVLLWHPLQKRIAVLTKQHQNITTAFSIAYHDLIQIQQQHVNIPKNFLVTARTIWELQFRLEKRKKAKCFDIVEHPRFRAAYDFLLLRKNTGENVSTAFDWWTAFYKADYSERKHLLNKLAPKPRKRKNT